MDKQLWNLLWAGVIVLLLVMYIVGIDYESRTIELVGFGGLLAIIAFGVVREK